MHRKLAARTVDDFFRKADVQKENAVYFVDFCNDFVRMQLFTVVQDISQRLRQELTMATRGNMSRDPTRQSEFEQEVGSVEAR